MGEKAMNSHDPFLKIFQDWIELFMHRSMQGTIQYARENSLSMSMIGTLFHLNRTGQAGVSDLGQHLGVSSAAASQMLDRLVEDDLIERSEDPVDRRMKKITLTQKGCRILRESMSARQRWLKELGEGLSDQEKEQVISALQLMIDKFPGIENSPHSSR
jgi:DNA-binding MarR family transcriptional regulator